MVPESTTTRVLGRVAQEVVEDLGKALRVGEDDRLSQLERLERPSRVGRTKQTHDVRRRQFLGDDGQRVQAVVTGGAELVDEGVDEPGPLGDRVEPLLPDRVALFEREQLGIGQDRGDGGSKVVAQLGDQVAFGLLRLGGGLAGGREFSAHQVEGACEGPEGLPTIHSERRIQPARTDVGGKLLQTPEGSQQPRPRPSGPGSGPHPGQPQHTDPEASRTPPGRHPLLLLPGAQPRTTHDAAVGHDVEPKRSPPGGLEVGDDRVATACHHAAARDDRPITGVGGLDAGPGRTHLGKEVVGLHDIEPRRSGSRGQPHRDRPKQQYHGSHEQGDETPHRPPSKT